jgi:hypothetical protein
MCDISRMMRRNSWRKVVQGCRTLRDDVDSEVPSSLAEESRSETCPSSITGSISTQMVAHCRSVRHSGVFTFTGNTHDKDCHVSRLSSIPVRWLSFPHIPRSSTTASASLVRKALAVRSNGCVVQMEHSSEQSDCYSTSPEARGAEQQRNVHVRPSS